MEPVPNPQWLGCRAGPLEPSYNGGADPQVIQPAKVVGFACAKLCNTWDIVSQPRLKMMSQFSKTTFSGNSMFVSCIISTARVSPVFVIVCY